MIVLENIEKKLGVRVLFEDVSLSFNTNHRYGLTGPNGAGKSTMLKIIMGQEEPTAGSVSLPKKVGFLQQNIEKFLDQNVIDVVIQGNQPLWKAMQERDTLYEGEMTDEIGMRLGELEEIVALEGGYTADSDAETLLHGIGIEESFFAKKMKELPTDKQFRALLCQALFGEPEALLLDEPTNHLDLESIKWLEDFLLEYKGTLIVVSHDRHFLNTVCTDIADIDYETIIVYPGNYDTMVAAKSQVRARTEQENKSKQKKVQQLQEFVRKFGAGTRASQVRSRVREIERLQPQDLKKSNIQRPYIVFNSPNTQSGVIPFKAKRITKKFHDNVVINNFSLEINRGDKIAIIGNNGIGKTTLLKMFAGLYTPDEGEIRLGNQVEIGYFPQNHTEVIAKDQHSYAMLDWLRNQKGELTEQEVRSVLGKLLFSGDDAFKKISALSGGETSRLILASIMMHPYNTLIMDEPNNHLDLESVSALGTALANYKGTVIVAAHDRDLIDHFATKIIALEKDQIRVFSGNLEEYLTQYASV